MIIERKILMMNSINICIFYKKQLFLIDSRGIKLYTKVLVIKQIGYFILCLVLKYIFSYRRDCL
jgi:hypothetical protein